MAQNGPEHGFSSSSALTRTPRDMHALTKSWHARIVGLAAGIAGIGTADAKAQFPNDFQGGVENAIISQEQQQTLEGIRSASDVILASQQKIKEMSEAKARLEQMPPLAQEAMRKLEIMLGMMGEATPLTVLMKNERLIADINEFAMANLNDPEDVRKLREKFESKGLPLTEKQTADSITLLRLVIGKAKVEDGIPEEDKALLKQFAEAVEAERVLDNTDDLKRMMGFFEKHAQKATTTDEERKDVKRLLTGLKKTGWKLSAAKGLAKGLIKGRRETELQPGTEKLNAMHNLSATTNDVLTATQMIERTLFAKPTAEVLTKEQLATE